MSHFLFHKTLDFFKSENLKNKKISIGVSGGVDSMVLLDVLYQVASPQKLKLSVIYVHHGESLDSSLQKYRKEAKNLVSESCNSLSIPFRESDFPQVELKSEEDFRKFRYEQFQKILQMEKSHFLALAHNGDDILETRLIHLIRGCGLEGLKSMDFFGSIPELSINKEQDFKKLETCLMRPFLFFSRGDILDYAQKKQLRWLEDPSNLNENFLRNWLRNKWLVDLEKKRPGSRFRLGQSLSQIVSSFSKRKDFLSHFITSEGIPRNLLRELSIFDQKRLLALYMRRQNIKNYGQSHIEEFLKHLDRKDKNITLNLLKRKWRVTPNFFYMENSK